MEYSSVQNCTKETTADGIIIKDDQRSNTSKSQHGARVTHTHMVHSLSYNRPWPRTASRTYMMTVVWLARVPSSDTESDVSSVVAQRGAREVNMDSLLVAPVREPASLRSSALGRQKTAAARERTGVEVCFGGHDS